MLQIIGNEKWPEISVASVADHLGRIPDDGGIRGE